MQMIMNRQSLGGSANDASMVKYKDGTVEEALDEFVNSEEFGTWDPTFSHYNPSEVAAQYYKIGKLVYISLAAWGRGDGSNEEVTISLPFKAKSVRNYGIVGYFPQFSNFPNLHVVNISGAQHASLEYGTNSTVTSIKGNQISGAFQFSLIYVIE